MRGQHEIIIHTEDCVGCGLCVRDCVAENLEIRDGTVSVKGRCIACGHCEAICPRHAVELTGFTDVCQEYEEQTRLDPAQLLAAIRTRRSIRQFTDQPVPQEILAQIIEAGRLAPTGSNSQGTGYIVLGSRQAELEGHAVSLFRNLTGVASVFSSYLRDRTIDDHFFFKSAPLVIVITGNGVDASLAAENMALMAEAHGLGVLFSGFFTVCANKNKRIRELMQMGAKEKAITTLVIGYPAVKYQRTVKREDANLRML